MKDEVEKAYGAASAYAAQLLGSDVADDDPDRNIIEPWAQTVTGPILDVGSGTGRWTGHLANLGYDIVGLEPAQPLLDEARQAHPDVEFLHGAIDDLTGTVRSWSGILAWYTLIHMGPDELPNALATLRAALADEGSLLLSFFTGPYLTPFDHPVTTAYVWPMTDMHRALEQAGFQVVDQNSTVSGPHANITAQTVG